MQVLRNSLLPSGLEAIRANLNRSQKSLRLFEVGSVFSASKPAGPYRADDISEESLVTIFLVGDRPPIAFRFIPYDAKNPLPDAALSVEIQHTDAQKPERAGWIGRMRSDWTRRFDVDLPVYACELRVSVLGWGLQQVRKFAPLPVYPAVRRDLAFSLSEGVAHDAVEATIRSTAGPLLESVVLFDVFSGMQAGGGKKSHAYALTFRSKTGTLVDAEVDGLVQRVVDAVIAKHDARLRSIVQANNS
jgi:phenylalanyl-tRNA synthetase beta chain